MNIFILSEDTTECAQMHADQHVGKMLVESCQLLCTAHISAPYKPTHVNHPCAVWVRSSLGRYCWLASLALELATEWEFRFGKPHASRLVAEWAIDYAHLARCPDSDVIKPFALAMPSDYKSADAVSSYRAYYAAKKRVLRGDFAAWTRREVPSWFSEAISLHP